MPAGPNRAPGLYDVPVSCEERHRQRAAWVRNVSETYKGSTEERNVKWDVILLSEALDPRQFRKRSYTREDCVSRDWYEKQSSKNCAHVTRPRRKYGLTGIVTRICSLVRVPDIVHGHLVFIMAIMTHTGCPEGEHEQREKFRVENHLES